MGKRTFNKVLILFLAGALLAFAKKYYILFNDIRALHSGQPFDQVFITEFYASMKMAGGTKMFYFCLQDLIFVILGLFLLSGSGGKYLTDTGTYLAVRKKRSLIAGEVIAQVLLHSLVYVSAYIFVICAMLIIKGAVPTVRSVMKLLFYDLYIAVFLSVFGLGQSILTGMKGRLPGFITAGVLLCLCIYFHLNASGLEPATVAYQMNVLLNPAAFFTKETTEITLAANDIWRECVWFLLMASGVFFSWMKKSLGLEKREGEG